MPKQAADCHPINGVGPTIGPDLGITPKKPQTDMPRYDYPTEEEMEALLAYLQTLK